MLLPYLLTLALAAQAPLPRGVRAAPLAPAASRVARAPGSLIDEAAPQQLAAGLLPRVASAGQVGVEVRLLAQSPSFSSTSAGASRATMGSAPRVYEVTIHPGTGYTEKFLLQEAGVVGARPLLVVFHKFGNSAYDVLQNTSFFAQAARRGWYCIAPLGASGVHFSSIESQINTRAALNWVANRFALDPSRIYAVGFSMGGGAALNYAARHVDPSGLMFAAVVNLSGTLSLKDTYVNDPGVQYILDFWFGNGTPGSASAWELERSSLISFDPLTLQPESGNDLARNLMHIDTRTVTATGDFPYLITQNNVLHDHFLSLGAAPTQHSLYAVNYPSHSWDMVSEKSVCDWLRTRQLVLPTAGNTLADENQRYFHFTVAQDAAGAFTPFTWNVQAGANSLALSNTANLQRVTVARIDAGLSATQPLTLLLSTADGLADEVRISDWPSLPSDVLRDGVSSALWSYDALAAELSVSEFDGGPHTWVVVP